MRFKRRYVKKLKFSYKTRFIIPLILVAFICIGGGYAYLTKELSIVGVTRMKENEWSVYFNNIQPISSSVIPTTAPTISNQTTISFAARLDDPGDKYEFYVDIVNDGSIDAMVDSILLSPELSVDDAKFFTYEVTYKGGNPISQHELLKSDTSKTIKVSYKYKESQNESDYPTIDKTFNVSLTINYIQADDQAVDYVGTNPCIYNGDLVQGATFTNGQYTYKYMQEYSWSSWNNITEDGWGVSLTDTESTSPVNTTLCSSINNKPIVSMSYMFYNSKATSIDMSSFDTSNVTNMEGMFYYITNGATSLDLSSFDTSSVTNMAYMFCMTYATSINISSFDTSNVTSMREMFNATKATSLDLSKFNTSKVTDMFAMFESSSATTLDLSSFDTSKVTNMDYMFDQIAATSINISSFDTSNVTSMKWMFAGYSNPVLDLSNFDTSKANLSNIFYDVTSSTVYGRTQADCDRLNASIHKPSGLIVTLKN